MKPKQLLPLVLVALTLAACRIPFIPTATPTPIRSPQPSVTPTIRPSLTPLPGQILGLTKAALLAPYETQHSTPIIFQTDTLAPIPTGPRATFTRTRTSTPATPTRACIAAYPDFCILQDRPRPSCQELGRYNFTVWPPDPFAYDPDDDGIGCEK